MKRLFAKLSRAFNSTTNRDRYLSDATDLVDLEFRMKRWDQMELERSRSFQDRMF